MPSDTRNVFGYNAVDTALFQIIHHAPKAWTVIIHACISIVKILLNQFDLRMLIQIVDTDLLLISNGVQLYIVSILHRKPSILACKDKSILFIFLFCLDMNPAFPRHLYHLPVQQLLIPCNFIPIVKINFDSAIFININAVNHCHNSFP